MTDRAGLLRHYFTVNRQRYPRPRLATPYTVIT